MGLRHRCCRWQRAKKGEYFLGRIDTFQGHGMSCSFGLRYYFISSLAKALLLAASAAGRKAPVRKVHLQGEGSL